MSFRSNSPIWPLFSKERHGDGVIGYVLAIGDIGHNDSFAHTRGVRKALGTGVEKDSEINSEPVGTNTDGSATAVQDSELEIGGKKYVVRELASQEMKNSAGATWDAATAEGYGGTISQHTDVHAYLTLRVLRNALDGVDIDTSIGTEDNAGNVLSDDVYVYREDERSYYALNVAVTAGNYQPLLQNYDKLLNLDVDYIGGDGQTEPNIQAGIAKKLSSAEPHSDWEKSQILSEQIYALLYLYQK